MSYLVDPDDFEGSLLRGQRWGGCSMMRNCCDSGFHVYDLILGVAVKMPTGTL